MTRGFLLLDCRGSFFVAYLGYTSFQNVYIQSKSDAWVFKASFKDHVMNNGTKRFDAALCRRWNHFLDRNAVFPDEECHFERYRLVYKSCYWYIVYLYIRAYIIKCDMYIHNLKDIYLPPTIIFWYSEDAKGRVEGLVLNSK
jgi:hypothetical protein